jgi:2-amino-4-hydroxy-6-hydroxymethyldihydropteridine diphosphokinase
LKTVYLSLGSNLGDRAAHLRTAVERLATEGMRIVSLSSIYETDPRDRVDQPRFLNMVVAFETKLFPLQLLSCTQKIERELGRRKSVDKGPRVIDIDILLYGHSIIRTDRLQIPHLRMAERRFVLEPLVELAPDLRHPALGGRVKDLLRFVADQGVEKWDAKKEPDAGQAPG